MVTCPPSQIRLRLRLPAISASVVQRVRPRRDEPLGDAVAHVDLLPAAAVAAWRRQRHRHGPVVVVLVVAVLRGPDGAPEVQCVAPGGRRRVRAARVAHAGEERVGGGGGRLGRRRSAPRAWRGLQQQRRGGEDEQGRHEEEAKAPAPP